LFELSEVSDVNITESVTFVLTKSDDREENKVNKGNNHGHN
jgi:hypothetical protein